MSSSVSSSKKTIRSLSPLPYKRLIGVAILDVGSIHPSHFLAPHTRAEQRAHQRSVTEKLEP